MKVAIIGCGLVGIEAAHHLRKVGHEVTGTTTRESRVAEIENFVDHVAVLKGSEEDKLAQLLEDKDAVIVCVSGGMFAQAGKGTVRDPALYKSIYIDTAECLNRVLANNRSVKQVIYTSAETVYAGIDRGPIVETTPPPGDSADAPTQAFIKTEEIIAQARELERKVCIFRLAIVYGRRFSMELMIELARKGPVPFSGDSVLTFVHVRDVGRALAFAVDKQLDGVYNLDASPSYYREIGKVLTNREFFGAYAAKETPPFEIRWLGLVKGWGEVSSQAILDAGFRFDITTPYFKEPEHADIQEAVRRLCIPMRDVETGKFIHKGYPVEMELSGGERLCGNAMFGIPFFQDLYVKTPDNQDRLMTSLLGVMQRGRDETKLLMQYYTVKSPGEIDKRSASNGKKIVRTAEVGELMYTLELQYDPDDDCYRGNQKYDVKLKHLIGMMPEEVAKKLFSKDKSSEASAAAPPAAPPGFPMPGAEWHILELYPSHTMYMHAFLASKSDDSPMPMMGMQKPYRFNHLH
jgi:nucleoside-diphosphate-sugar epimerase